ncbi:MAG TPA: hypothetical protein VG826_09010 [Pirellulales bacterium]|nr:hypothetical protein [Pirellulales bacterium]
MSIRKIARSFMILGMGAAQCASPGLTVRAEGPPPVSSDVATLARAKPSVAKAQPRLAKTPIPASPASMQVGSMPPGVAPTGAGPATFWKFMGVPQGWQKLRGATANRRGNLPGREPTPPLKAIADPANLQSGNPAIEAACKIKQQEDLAPQKIKALKYLATIGCGCYDKAYDVKGAFMAALDDCTEEVRLQAAKSVGKAAETQCAVCSKSCCCTAEMMQKLNDVATLRDDEGCFVETSADVRQAACEALLACKRRVRVYPAPAPVPVRDDEAQPETESQPDMPAPPQASTGGQADLISEILGEPSSPVQPKAKPGVRATAVASRTVSEPESSHSPAEVPSGGRSSSGSLSGTVVGIDAKTSTVDVEFEGRRQPTIGSHFSVHHNYALSTAHLGRLEIVYLAGNGRAIARPVGRTDIAKLGKGDRLSGRIMEDEDADAPIITGVSRQTKKGTVRSCVEPPQPAIQPSQTPYLPEEPSPSDTETTQSGGKLRTLIASWLKPEGENEEGAALPAELAEPVAFDEPAELAKPKLPLVSAWKSLLKPAPESSVESSPVVAAPDVTTADVTTADVTTVGETVLKPQTARPAQPARLASAGVALTPDVTPSELRTTAKASSSKKTQTKRSAPAVVVLEE